MKRVLFISSRPLYPIIGGDQIRTVQQLRFLEERFIVDVLFLTNELENEEVRKHHKNVNNVFTFHSSKIRNYIQALRFLINKLPIQVNYYFDKRVSKFIDGVINNYDAVFCNNIRTAEYGINASSIIKYIDFVDAISMNYEKARKRTSGIKKMIYSIDFRRCKLYEQHCLSKFDSCAIISDIDNKYLQV